MRLLVTMLMTCLGSALAAAEPVLTVAANQEAEPPWVLPSGDGLSQQLIRLAARRAGIEVRFVPVPWARGVALLEAGGADALANASYTGQRAGFAHYPLDTAGNLDSACRLHRETYSLYRRIGDPLDWDPALGVRNRSGLIAAQSGFSIIGILRDQGIPVDEAAPLLVTNLEKLAAERVQGAALSTLAADQALRDHPQLAARIERLPRPLATRDYFLIFSRACMDARGAACKALWAALAQERAGADYRRLSEQAGVPAE